MSKATKRKSSSSGSKSRSSSIGAREKRLSVFDRLGTKAPPGEPPRLCTHNIYHAYCTTCRPGNNQSWYFSHHQVYHLFYTSLFMVALWITVYLGCYYPLDRK